MRHRKWLSRYILLSCIAVIVNFAFSTLMVIFGNLPAKIVGAIFAGINLAALIAYSKAEEEIQKETKQ